MAFNSCEFMLEIYSATVFNRDINRQNLINISKYSAPIQAWLISWKNRIKLGMFCVKPKYELHKFYDLWY